MIEIVKAPHLFNVENKVSVFLAGSIEMGDAEDWQTKLTQRLFDNQKIKKIENLMILNPRRDDWDSSWEQKITNPSFKEQVSWELSAQEQSDVVAMYFDPKTKSPISMLELGLFCVPQKMVVCCPDGFWRKGNVDIVCERYLIDLSNDFDRFCESVTHTLLIKERKRIRELSDGNVIFGK